MRKMILAVLTLTVVPGWVEAQIASTATPLTTVFAAECAAQPVLELFTLRYNQGDWPVLQRQARSLLDELRGVSTPLSGSPAAPTPTPTTGCTAPEGVSKEARAALDYKSHDVALAWIGADALGKTQLFRAVVHWPEPDAYSSDLPGIAGLTEVFLAGSVSARAASLYSSTAEKDPIGEQLPGFLQAVFGPLSTMVAGVLGGVTGGVDARSFSAAPTPPHLGVTISGVVLPLARASIRLQMKAKDFVTVREFTDVVARLGTTLLFDGAGRSNPARTQIASLVNDLPVVAAANCAAAAGGAPLPVVCRTALDTAIKAAYDAAIAGTPSDADMDAIDEVDRQFRGLAVNALSASAELDMTFKNRPLTHFAFGAGSAVMVTAHLNRVRAKIQDDSGALVADPLPRVMTMAFVNWSPGGYDDSSSRPSVRERVRGFFGASLTPDFGVVGGINVSLKRGIGVVVGAGALFGNGADSAEIGEPPIASHDPFELATTKTVFVGISYNYK
jgi:hypothetical protein